jgi:hypothetical protein
MLVALTGQGSRGQNEQLLLQWCEGPREEGQGDKELKAQIDLLLLAHRGDAESDGTNGTLVGLLPCWQASNAVAIQAAYRRHLHKV